MCREVYGEIDGSKTALTKKEEVRLAELEALLEEHDPDATKFTEKEKEEALRQAHQLQLHVERCRVPEARRRHRPPCCMEQGPTHRVHMPGSPPRARRCT